MVISIALRVELFGAQLALELVILTVVDAFVDAQVVSLAEFLAAPRVLTVEGLCPVVQVHVIH